MEAGFQIKVKEGIGEISLP